MSNNAKQVFDRLKGKVKVAVRRLPIVFGNETVNFALENFDNQSWPETGPWPPRASNKSKDSGRALLVKSGRMRRQVSNGKKEVSENRVVVKFGGVPYMKIHNDGGVINQSARSETFKRNRFTRGGRKGKFKKGISRGQGFTFKKRSIRIPQRKFVGRSQALVNRLRYIGQLQIAKALK